MARTAAEPNRRASSRSNVVGEPPRWRWPRTRLRVSFPGRRPISPATSSAFPLEDLLADLFDIEGDLGNEDDVRAPREPAVQCDPSGVPPHQLHDEHAVVALGGRMDLVQGVGRGAHRRVEPEGGFGPRDVVVDRLGYADDRYALAEEPVRDAQAPIPSDRDQRVEPAVVEGADQVVGAVFFDDAAIRLQRGPVERITAVGGAEDRAAQVGDPAYLVGAEPHEPVARAAPPALRPGPALPLPALPRENPVVAAVDAVGFPPALVRRQDDGTNDRVEPGSVAAAGGDGDSQPFTPSST